MISAVLLVNTDVGEENRLLENIKSMEGVEEAHAVWGVYDLMVKMKADSIDKLKEIIKFRLRLFAGVTNILTLMVIDDSEVPEKTAGMPCPCSIV